MEYQGNELELFAKAHRWRSYWADHVRPYVRGRVLEVGSGTGSATLSLVDSSSSWCGLEPDESLLRDAARRLHEAGHRVEYVAETLDQHRKAEGYDTILYIDVLEHIENDLEELRLARHHLAHGGRLIVLAPAHQRLYSDFDKHVGHYRRYSARSFRRLDLPGLRLRSVRYLDSVGTVLSLANRILLKQSLPTPAQIEVWDRKVVPLSRVFDRLTGYHFGKTVVGIWEKQ